MIIRVFLGDNPASRYRNVRYICVLNVTIGKIRKKYSASSVEK